MTCAIGAGRCVAVRCLGSASRVQPLWGRLTGGKCRLGYVIGLTPSTLHGPCNVSQWTSKFTRKLVKSSLGGAVYALSEMILLLVFWPFEGPKPGTAGLEDCESLFAHLKTKKMIAGNSSVRHFMGFQRALVEGESDNAHWAPGTENPAGGLIRVRNDMVPLSRVLESGHFNPGSSRPFSGVAWKERGGRGKFGN